MAKDAVATMGGLLPDDAGGRDAVHVAVVSAVSEIRLRPGQDVGVEITEGRDVKARVVSSTTQGVGIVDPYLSAIVEPGQRFWLYLYPRSITGLNHNWSHPAFPDVQAKASSGIYSPPGQVMASEQWLRNFCEANDAPSYDYLMEIVAQIADGKSRGGGEYSRGDDYDHGWHHDGEYLVTLGSDAHCEIPPELWTHVENVLGRKIAGAKATYFSCSC